MPPPGTAPRHYIYIEHCLDICGFLGEPTKKARSPNLRSYSGLDGGPQVHAVWVGIAEIEVHVALEAIDCLRKLPGPLHHKYRHGTDWLLPEHNLNQQATSV